jgi:hypothetical protein
MVVTGLLYPVVRRDDTHGRCGCAPHSGQGTDNARSSWAVDMLIPLRLKLFGPRLGFVCLTRILPYLHPSRC